jgi:hypothetical protein
MFLLTLPNSDRHPQVQITVSHAHWESKTTLDDSHKQLEIKLPEGCHIDDVEIVAHFCNVNGVPDPLTVGMLMKAKVHHEVKDEGKSPDSHSDDSANGATADAEQPATGGSEAEADGPVSEAGHEQEEPVAKGEVEDSEAALLAAWAAEEAAKAHPAE